jgi:hypothetical protein
VSADSVSSVVARLIEVLEASGEIYAFGGAVALASWSEPRATADVDIVIWVEPSRVDRAIDLAEAAGVRLDREEARAAALERGLIVGRLGAIRVDVFVPSIPFYDEAAERRARVRIAGKETWVHSAETLAVFKLLFFRPKDLLDVARMLEVRGASFDRAFVRASLAEMLGEDDPRIARWDEICASAAR